MLIDSGSGDGGGGRWPIKRIVAGVVALVIALLLASQLILPRVAERRIRSKLSESGVAARVKVSTFPAAKLLLGRVDSAVVTVDSAQITREKVAGLVAATRDIDALNVVAPSMQVAGIALTDVTLRKRGSVITTSATTGRADLLALLPPGSRLARVRPRDGGIELDGSITVLGASVSGPGQLRPSDGALVFTTPALPVIGPTTLTVFTDPRVKIDRISVRTVPPGLRFSAGGRVTGAG